MCIHIFHKIMVLACESVNIMSKINVLLHDNMSLSGTIRLDAVNNVGWLPVCLAWVFK